MAIKRPVRLLILGLAVLGVLFVALRASGGPSAAASAHVRTVLSEDVLIANGEPTPRGLALGESAPPRPYDVEAVLTTFGKAPGYAGRYEERGLPASTPIYLVAMRGHFSISCSAPAGDSCPHGSVRVIMVLASDLRGIYPEPTLGYPYPDLKKWGKPFHVSMSGARVRWATLRVHVYEEGSGAPSRCEGPPRCPEPRAKVYLARLDPNSKDASGDNVETHTISLTRGNYEVAVVLQPYPLELTAAKTVTVGPGQAVEVTLIDTVLAPGTSAPAPPPCSEGAPGPEGPTGPTCVQEAPVPPTLSGPLGPSCESPSDGSERITPQITLTGPSRYGMEGSTPWLVGDSSEMTAESSSPCTPVLSSAAPAVCFLWSPQLHVGSYAHVGLRAPGRCTIVASVPAGGEYKATNVKKSFPVLSQVIAGRRTVRTPQKITLNVPPTAEVGQAAAVTAEAASGGISSVSSATPAVCTVSLQPPQTAASLSMSASGTVHFIASGTCTIVVLDPKKWTTIRDVEEHIHGTIDDEVRETIKYEPTEAKQSITVLA